MTQAICTPSRSRAEWVALAVSIPLTLMWLFAFRTGLALGIPAGAWMWILAVMTAAAPLALSTRLFRSSV